MPQGSKLSEFERGRNCELHKQGFRSAIVFEIHRSKTVIFNFLNAHEGYGKEKYTGSVFSTRSVLVCFDFRKRPVYSLLMCNKQGK